MDRYLPEEQWIVRSHAAAIKTGAIVGGEEETIAVNLDECEAPL
jgi:hypothetical protein